MDVRNYYRLSENENYKIERIGFYDFDYFKSLENAADHKQIHWLPKANDGDKYLMECFIAFGETITKSINKNIKYVLLLENNTLVQPNFDNVYSEINK